MGWINPARAGRGGIRLDAPIAQLFSKPLTIPKKVIAVRMEAAPVMITARKGQVNMRVIAIGMKRCDP
jgi:hypothetical protein